MCPQPVQGPSGKVQATPTKGTVAGGTSSSSQVGGQASQSTTGTVTNMLAMAGTSPNIPPVGSGSQPQNPDDSPIPLVEAARTVNHNPEVDKILLRDLFGKLIANIENTMARIAKNNLTEESGKALAAHIVILLLNREALWPGSGFTKLCFFRSKISTPSAKKEDDIIVTKFSPGLDRGTFAKFIKEYKALKAEVIEKEQEPVIPISYLHSSLGGRTIYRELGMIIDSLNTINALIGSPEVVVPDSLQGIESFTDVLNLVSSKKTFTTKELADFKTLQSRVQTKLTSVRTSLQLK